MFKQTKITQPEVAALLEDQIKKEMLPASLLFAGCHYSSRLTAALETAEGMGCDFSDTALITNRDFSVEIAAAIKMFKKNKNRASALFLKKIIKTFLIQFNGFLMSRGSSEEKNIFSKAGDCTDLVSELDNIKEKEATSFCKKIELLTSVLLKYTQKKSQINIARIRSVKLWVNQYSINGVPRVIILEGIEDTSETVKNSLLKSLEEPPEGTHFIILSSNPGKIMATIISRVRRYWFAPIIEKRKNEFLASLFVDGKKYSSLERFFIINSGTDIDAIDKKVDAFLLEGQSIDKETEAMLDKGKLFGFFYKRIAARMEELSMEGKIDKRKAGNMLTILDREVKLSSSFNQTGLITFNAVLKKLRG